YEPLTTSPGEAESWRRLKEHMAAVREPIRQALALSRKNLDVEAREQLLRIEPTFQAIDRDVATLVEINQRAADQALTRTREIQRSATRLDAILGAIALLVTIGVGVGVTRLVWSKDEQIARYTSTLEQRNRELDAFAGRVAHDLRGPLTTITVTAERL